MVLPLPGFILVEPKAESTVSKSGLEYANEAFKSMGTVLAVGMPGMNEFGHTVTTPVAVGQTVIFDRMAAVDFGYQGKTYNFLRFQHLLGVIEGK